MIPRSPPRGCPPYPTAIADLTARSFLRQRAKRGINVQARAGLYFADDVEYIQQIAAEYPDKGIANWEEARCLFSEHGYNILDIRCADELDVIGNFPRDKAAATEHRGDNWFHHVPIINATYRYDSEAGKKLMKNQEGNRGFVDEVQKKFPDKNTRIIIACSDGRNRAIQALEALDDAGYVNIVGLRGGYNMWNRQWDQNMRRRNLPGNFKEEFSHGAEGMGVHGTGASFQNQDAFQYADWKDSTKWMEWTSGTIPADE